MKYGGLIFGIVIMGTAIGSIIWDENFKDGGSAAREARFNAERIQKLEQNVESTPGLEGCKYIEVGDRYTLLRVIRCPASSTTVSYEAGKNYRVSITTEAK